MSSISLLSLKHFFWLLITNIALVEVKLDYDLLNNILSLSFFEKKCIIKKIDLTKKSSNRFFDKNKLSLRVSKYFIHVT